jgi:CheY-like chemotaxis protein
MVPTGKTRTILVVDDEPELRASLRSMLESCDYVVSEAAGTTEALVAIETRRPDLVLTDIFLGDGDGYALINALQINEENIPVIAMSGGAISGGSMSGTDADGLSLASKLGAAAVIDKPFRLKDLLALIERTIAASAS